MGYYKVHRSLALAWINASKATRKALLNAERNGTEVSTLSKDGRMVYDKVPRVLWYRILAVAKARKNSSRVTISQTNHKVTVWAYGSGTTVNCANTADALDLYASIKAYAG